MLDNTISMGFSAVQCDYSVPGIWQNTGQTDSPFVIDQYSALQCMEQLVNHDDIVVSTYYHSGKYWQFDSFDATGPAMGPMGTPSQPFSGHIIGPAGSTATISHLNIEGVSPNVGLFGVIESPFSFSDVHFTEFSVSAANDLTNVGGIIGTILKSADPSPATISNCFVSGTVSAPGNGQYIGGLVGAVALETSGLTLSQVSFVGAVSGSQGVGGLIGWADASVAIESAQVHANVSSATAAGGLVGAFAVQSTSSVTLQIDQAIVTGTINASEMRAGGIVSYVSNSTTQFGTLSVSHIIMGAEVTSSAVVTGIAYLYGKQPSMSNVVNVAWSSAGSNANAAKAALTYGVDPDTADSVYRFEQMTSVTQSYVPFVDDKSGYQYNGTGVSCATFSDPEFWKSAVSMDLKSSDGWDFNKIAQGYLPTLNGVEHNQAFSCMNQITYPTDWTSVSASASFGVSPILPIAGATGSVHYFPANSAPNAALYSFNVGAQAPFDVFYAGQSVATNLANGANWQLPAEGLLKSGTISLKKSNLPAEFSFSLVKSDYNLLLSWTAVNSQSVSIVFTTLTNLAGGTPPGISASQYSYQGTATSETYTLGPAFAGTYLISVSGSMLGIGATSSIPVSGSLTWTNYLQMAMPESSVSFPDVFTGGHAKTITYKYNGKASVSRVLPLNQGRYASIRWLMSMGITVGSQSNQANNTTYRPQDSVNRGAMAQFLQKLAGFTDAQIAARFQGHTTTFTDIGSLLKSNPARYYAILWLTDLGIVGSCGSGGGSGSGGGGGSGSGGGANTKFCPQGTVNRGAAAEILRKFVGLAATSAVTSSFPDVNLTSKTLKYDGSSQAVSVPAVNAARMGAINWLSDKGITLGSGSSGGVTTYRPQDPVTRGAMAEFMRKVAILVGSIK
jgi:hypothetical protein